MVQKLCRGRAGKVSFQSSNERRSLASCCVREGCGVVLRSIWEPIQALAKMQRKWVDMM